MRRTFAVLGWILVGAVASGVSLGYYLFQANNDRQWLGVKIAAAEEAQLSLQRENERLADTANQRTQNATTESSRLRTLLQSCEERTSRLVRAEVLAKPDGRALRGWTETLSLSLGVSLKLPPGTQASDRDQYLEAATTGRGTTSTWLMITPYDQLREQELAEGLTDTEAVSYAIDGTLASGIRGRTPSGNGSAYILRIGSDRAPSHLIWAQTNDKIISSRILDTLATLTFKSTN